MRINTHTNFCIFYACLELLLLLWVLPVAAEFRDVLRATADL